MLSRAAMALFLLLGAAPPAGAQSVSVEILKPADQARVGHRPPVEGRVSHPRAKLLVVVKHEATGDVWVQDRVDVDPNGRWRCRVSVGRPGATDAGKKFTIRAVMNPRNPDLKEGDVLGEWPAGYAVSRDVEVTRRP